MLKCLQDMSSVPLAEELVHGTAPQPLTYLDAGKVDQVSVCGGAMCALYVQASMLDVFGLSPDSYVCVAE